MTDVIPKLYDINRLHNDCYYLDRKECTFEPIENNDCPYYLKDDMTILDCYGYKQKNESPLRAGLPGVKAAITITNGG